MWCVARVTCLVICQLGNSIVPRLSEYLTMPPPSKHVLRYPLPDRVPAVFVQVFSPPLVWSGLSSFLAVWSPSGDTQSPSVVFEVVDVKCPGPHFSHIADYVDDYYSLP